MPLAEVNQFAVVARRHGNEWFLGAINNSEARTLEIPLDFLGSGNWTIDLCRDASDSFDNPNHLIEETLTAGKTLTINLASGGGFAAKIR